MTVDDFREHSDCRGGRKLTRRTNDTSCDIQSTLQYNYKSQEIWSLQGPAPPPSRQTVLNTKRWFMYKVFTTKQFPVKLVHTMNQDYTRLWWPLTRTPSCNAILSDVKLTFLCTWQGKFLHPQQTEHLIPPGVSQEVTESAGHSRNAQWGWQPAIWSYWFLLSWERQILRKNIRANIWKLLLENKYLSRTLQQICTVYTVLVINTRRLE